MHEIPRDILQKIQQLFPVPDEQQQVVALISGLWTQSLNVGPAQLARAILTLSENDLAELKSLFGQQFLGDPRDVILMAESKAGNPGTYFLTAFD
ncbi:MAG: hypothetical protein HYZ14_06690 [Bacteroidetes bacterium]|nr:hypothetical protein [Bacteroidota bacterium]